MGLVDSPKVRLEPGKVTNLTAVVAPNARAAAQYYPANYWFSLVKPPEKSEFPGTGPQGNGISPNIKSQAQWLRLMKTDSCWSCHQLGNKATREIPKSPRLFRFLGSSLGAPYPVRTSGRQYARRHRPARQGAGARDVRRLDRPRRQGRTAARAGASARRRAQRRRHPVGLGRSQGVSPR